MLEKKPLSAAEVDVESVDADADGEYDDEDAEAVPPTSGASSSYHSKRVVRGYAFWWCRLGY